MSFIKRLPDGWVRGSLILGVLTVPALALYVAVRCYRNEAWSFVGQRHAIDPARATEALGEVEDVILPLSNARVHGVYAPSRNHAAVVLCHGSGGDRYGLLAEARALHAHGFGVLLLDFPGHGQSEGTVHWSAGEVRTVRAAVDHLSARADVDPKRLGILGFSMGGYITALAAAQDPRLRAVAIAAAPPDAREHTRYEYRRWTWLGQRAALWALERHGMDLDGPSPLHEITRISPRALLVIGGTDDRVVPASMVEALFAAARAPKQLLMIEGAAHGDYADVPGSRYLEALAQFFASTLE